MSAPEAANWGEFTPETLQDACARGEAAALTLAVELLDARSAYDRAHGSDALSLAPSEALAERLAAALESGLGALWWRVLALRHEEGVPWPDGLVEPLATAIREAAAGGDADVLFQLSRLIGALSADDAAVVGRAVILSGDDEVSSGGARAVAALRALDDEELARLQEVKAPFRSLALLARVEGGDGTASPELAASLFELGPLLAQAADALERGGGHTALPALRAHWKRRFFVAPAHVLAAGCAAALGDDEALASVRRWAERGSMGQRRAVRATALGELARLGRAEDDARVEAALEGPHASWVVSQLGRSGSARWRRHLLEAAPADPRDDVRLAAADALGESSEPGATEALRALCADPSDDVRAAARRSLAARGEGMQ